jgi:hypothetical protein
VGRNVYRKDCRKLLEEQSGIHGTLILSAREKRDSMKRDSMPTELAVIKVQWWKVLNYLFLQEAI